MIRWSTLSSFSPVYFHLMSMVSTYHARTFTVAEKHEKDAIQAEERE